MRGLLVCGAALVAGLLAGGQARAAQCEPPGGFPAFIQEFRQEAASAGVSPRALAALDGLSVSNKVLSLDRNQKSFRMSFEEFARQRISSGRVSRGTSLMRQHAGLLSRIEQQFGVPPEIIVAIWGLETDFGANMGNMPIMGAIATLAHDCRRTELFQDQLMSALRIIDRGDLSLSQMRGAWAGELGQTQFLASSYWRFAIDYDGDGRRDLINSVPDVLGSTANYLRSYGWQRGGGYGEGTRNFAVLKEWNRAAVYQKTIAEFARRLAGNAPAAASAPASGGGGGAGLSRGQIVQLQQLLAQRGHNVGAADGIVGQRTRAAIAAEQNRMGMAATGRPDAAFLQAISR